MAKTIYKKKIKNGKEYYFYRLRHENLNKPKDLYASTVKELECKIKKAIHELDNSLSSDNITFGEFLKKWLFDIKFLKIKNTSKCLYEVAYRRYIKGSSISKIKLKHINAATIQTFINKLKRDNVSISMIKSTYLIISPCLRYAYDNNYIIKDFTRSIILPREDEKTKLEKQNKIHSFTLEEQKQFINIIKGNKHECLYLTALYSGLRQSELLALTWNDIDFENKTISVNKIAKYQRIIKNGERANFKTIVQTPKTKGSIRVVPIPDELVKALKKHKKRNIEVCLRLGIKFKNSDLLFYGINYNSYLTNTTIYIHFKRIAKKIRAEITFHDLRHTFATRLFELNINAKTVQKLLGHSNISTTLNIYTSVLQKVENEATNKLNDLYKNMAN